MIQKPAERIPSIIHYVWFGGSPKSDEVKRCIKSWEKYCPSYKIVEWNEDNYDISVNRYMYEAYKEGKWAFASDYARYDIIYRYGGIYLDTDVELVAGMNGFLDDRMFMGFLENKRVASGLGFGSIARNPILKEILEYYTERSFYKDNGEMDLRICNHNETAVLVNHGLICNGQEQWLDWAHIYPQEYLNPLDLVPTQNTVAINHFSGSWKETKHKNQESIREMKQLADKHLKMFFVMKQWVKVKQEGKNLASYFDKQGYRSIAIYGMSYIGETLLEELDGSEIEVKYAIDRNVEGVYAEITVVSMEDMLDKVDAVIVTVLTSFEEIKSMLGTRLDCPVISLEDVLFRI